MSNKLIMFSVLLMLLIPVSSASVIDDADNFISGLINNIKPLSVPIIGSVTVSCADGSTTCKYYGDNWHIQTNVIASNQNLVFTLPAGTQWTDAAGTTTSGTTVKFTLTPLNAFQKQPVTLIGRTYRTCWLFVCGWDKPIPGYQVSGYSYKEVSINAKIDSAYGSNTVPLSYNYNTHPTYSLSDGKYTMQFSPSYIVDWGIDMGVSSLVFVDNGYGEYIAFSSSAFYTAQQATEADLYTGLTGLPTNWVEYLAYMKNKHGLVQYQLPTGTTLKITDSNAIASLEYPYGAVGIVGEILIPKGMATSVTVQIDDGKPEIGTISVSPNPFTLGSGYITVTVPVKNVGTTSDNFQMTIDQSFGVVTYVKNGGIIAKGGSDIYTGKITPTVTTSQTQSFNVKVEATGSHDIVSVTKTVSLVASSPDNPKQWVAITTLDPDGKGLSSAPIFQNGVQIGTGFKRVELEYGTYEFSTNNISNPTLFAPNPVSITLSGGAEKEILFKFSKYPPAQDYTWIFWLVIGSVIIFVAWRSGFAQSIMANPMLLIPIVLVLFMLWILLQVLVILTGLTDTASNTIDFISTLGGILK